MHNKLQLWLAIAVILLNAYTFGASCVERFVNYQTWPLLSRADFAAYHRAQQSWVLGFIVFPLALSFGVQVAFCLVKPSDVPWTVALALLIPSILGFASTILFQLPIHRSLSELGYSESHVSLLLRTDWIRKVLDVVRLASTVWLLRHLVA